MRRKQCEITGRDSIDAILFRCTIGRMATVGADGFPYITPVNYVYHNGTVYFHSARSGEKIDNIRRDPRVCFQVDIPLAYLDLDYYGAIPEPCLLHQFYHCVIIRGRAEIVQRQSEKLAALNELVARHERVGRKFEPITEQTPAANLCEVIAIRIESVSGKSDLAQKKTAEEKRALSNYLRRRSLPGDNEAADLLEPRDQQ